MNWRTSFFILLGISALIIFLLGSSLAVYYDLGEATTPEEICKLLAWDGADFKTCMESYETNR